MCTNSSAPPPAAPLSLESAKGSDGKIYHSCRNSRTYSYLVYFSTPFPHRLLPLTLLLEIQDVGHDDTATTLPDLDLYVTCV